jgi:hypothetical protein
LFPPEGGVLFFRKKVRKKLTPEKVIQESLFRAEPQKPFRLEPAELALPRHSWGGLKQSSATR